MKLVSEVFEIKFKLTWLEPSFESIHIQRIDVKFQKNYWDVGNLGHDWGNFWFLTDFMHIFTTEVDFNRENEI